MVAPNYALEVREVSRRYGRRWALSRVSFGLQAGHSLLLTGPNGSGKTTLLRTLATAISPTAGTVRILGWDGVAHRSEIRRNVALLSHSSFLYEDLTAEQNLLLLARLLRTRSAKEVVGSLLSRLGLSTRSAHPVRQFSAGMRKRLSIARLLLKQPRLVLLDEPFGDLDPSGIAQMEQIVTELQQAGTTVVLATHLVEQGRALCDERLHLLEGRVAAA